MKRLFYTLIVLFLLCLAACNRTATEPVKKYTRITRWGEQEIIKLPFDSLVMSDPYILADDATRMYYLTGTNGTLWKSTDLKMWEGPYSYIEIDTTSWMGASPMIWAPELHKYNGKYYCFVTLTNSKIIVDTIPDRYNVPRRSTHILVSEKAGGPYRPIKNTIYLPENWGTLDGTFWEEEGVPYMVFCHEWMQIIDGTIEYIQLSPDLSESIGEPRTMFKATDAPWPKEMCSIGELTFGMALEGYTTDGPFLFRTGTGRLGMLWSSWGATRYAQGVAYSESGKLAGPWSQTDEAIDSKNSGHGMLFRTFEGKLLLLLHYQGLNMENPGPRKPTLLEIDLSGDEVKILGKYNP